MEGVSLPFLFLGFLFLQLSTCFSGLRSAVYFRQYGLNLHCSFSVKLYYIGNLFNIILPSSIGGDAYKVFRIHKLFNFSKIKAARVILYERVSGLFILFLLCLLYFYFSNFYDELHVVIKYMFVPLSIASVPVYFICSKYILRDKIQAMCAALPYSCLVQILQIFMIYTIIYSIAPEIDTQMQINYVFLFIVSSIVSIIPITIGGAGLRELTFLIGLDYLQAPKELGVSIAIIVFVLQVMIGLCGVPYYLKSKALIY